VRLSNDSRFGQRITVALVVEAEHGVVNGAFQMIGTAKGLMSQMVPFEIAPNLLDIVQFGGVLRQALDGQPVRAGGQRRPGRLARGGSGRCPGPGPPGAAAPGRASARSAGREFRAARGSRSCAWSGWCGRRGRAAPGPLPHGRASHSAPPVSSSSARRSSSFTFTGDLPPMIHLRSPTRAGNHSPFPLASLHSFA